MADESQSVAAASQRAHRSIQWVLRVGLLVSVVLILVGLVAALATGETGGEIVHLDGLFTEATRADRVIAVGLTALAMTPLVRVLALVAIWVRERDRRFVVVAVIVAAILAASIATGHL